MLVGEGRAGAQSQHLCAGLHAISRGRLACALMSACLPCHASLQVPGLRWSSIVSLASWT